MTEKEKIKLIEKAKEAAAFSHSPYSDCKVGAALLCKSGRIFTGCNIENAAFSPTVCAERTAIFKAVSEGEKEFSAIAVVGGKDGVFTSFFPPCGVCRQVMREFCNDDFEVVLSKENGETKTILLGELLPDSFCSNAFKDA